MNDLPMQTVCVGRMLMDLPKGKQSWQQQFDYAKVSKLPVSVNTKEAFDAYVQGRKSELKKPTKINPDGRLGLYEKTKENIDVIQFRPRNDDHLGFATERYLWLGKWGYKYQTGGVFNDEAAVLLSRIKEIPDHVIPIQNTDPPDQSGFCIDSALVTGDIGPIYSSLALTLNHWKGVIIDVAAREDDSTRDPLPWQRSSDSKPTITPFYALKVRQEGAGEDQDVASFDIIRKRERRLIGMPGEEFAFKRVLSNGREYYRFMWGTVNENSRPDQSGFTLILHAGSKRLRGDYDDPPPEDDLLALWDAMLSSLKRRSDAH